LYDWMRFVDLSDAALVILLPELAGCPRGLLAEIREDARYAPYLARQDAEIRTMRANENIALDTVDFQEIAGLSTEMRERLEAARPATLAAAERLRGITPAALAAVLVAAKRKAA
ncbi:MAG: hypothetical protein RL367_971, partial [Pseudomonadota bacterium]